MYAPVDRTLLYSISICDGREVIEVVLAKAHVVILPPETAGPVSVWALAYPNWQDCLFKMRPVMMLCQRVPLSGRHCLFPPLTWDKNGTPGKAYANSVLGQPPLYPGRRHAFECYIKCMITVGKYLKRNWGWLFQFAWFWFFFATNSQFAGFLVKFSATVALFFRCTTIGPTREAFH